MKAERQIISESISDQVYAFLEEDIISQKYPAGSRIDLEEIEQSLGISRIPIRDALERLIEKGLVRKIPRVGYFTVKPTVDELKDLFHVRRLLEESVFSQEHKFIDEQLVVELRDRLMKFTGRQDFTVEEKREFLNLDLILHRDVIIGMSDNRLLESIYEGIKTRINLSAHVMHRFEQDLIEHLSILNALLDRDWAHALESLRRHLQATEETTLQYATEGAT